MRTIKFEAWDSGSQTMHSNVLTDGKIVIAKYNMLGGEDLLIEPMTYSVGENGLFTLREFTERLDINGKEIYEGDIIRHGQSIRFIEKRGSNFSATRPSKTETILLSFCESPEVLGNIYMNPDMLLI